MLSICARYAEVKVLKRGRMKISNFYPHRAGTRDGRQEETLGGNGLRAYYRLEGRYFGSETRVDLRGFYLEIYFLSYS